jgi:hypothetical protein
VSDDWKKRATPNVISHTEGFDASDYERPAKTVEQPTFHLKLPMPPLANDLVRPAIIGRRGRRVVARLVKTKEAKPWYGIVKAHVFGAYNCIDVTALRGPVYLHATWFLRKLDTDVDGPVKALMDALKAVGIWHDDCQVVHLDVTKDLCAIGEKPWCEVKTGAYWHHNAEVRQRLANMKKAGGGR